MPDFSLPVQTRDETRDGGPATSNHKQACSVEILLYSPGKPGVWYLFRLDESQVLLVGHDPTDNHIMRIFCGNHNAIPSNIVKHTQFTWTDNTLQVINLSSRNVSYFRGAPHSVINMKPHTVYAITKDITIFFDQCDLHIDWATIKFIYDEVGNTEARSGFNHSQMAPSLAPPVSVGSPYPDLSSENSPENKRHECVDLTTTEDEESDDAEANPRGVVHDRDRLMGAPCSEEGSVMNQSSTTQEKERKRVENGQGIRSSARAWASAFTNMQASSPMERSQVNSLGFMALGAAAMWGVLAVELL
ncbi:hypothetical protein FRC09_004023 [Ceratobasidium sp. 395]|nr:hypothetical protein FRC09_004023 [Ceratobasidium sp. 395]